MEVLAGFALGLAASLHCGAMCGPLVVALYGGGPAAAGGARARRNPAGGRRCSCTTRAAR
jgi:sulfite exporter TauE/SafE